MAINHHNRNENEKMTSPEKNIVYVLTNLAMPGLVKIGMTDRSVEDRVKELSHPSGVPTSFKVHYACTVKDAEFVEKQVHLAFNFGDNRLNQKREFFKIDPQRIVDILKLVEIEDVTPFSDPVDDNVN